MPRTIQIDDEQPVVLAEYPNIYTPIPPSDERCKYSGLSKGHLYQLLIADDGMARKYVRVVSLREPDRKAGKQLFHVGDFLHWLDSLAKRQGTGQLREPSPIRVIM